MNDASLDHVRDLMIRALYDELGLEERQELEQVLAAQPELAREWQELAATRVSLAVLTDTLAVNPSPFELPPEQATPLRAYRSRAWQMWTATAGFAAAAALFCGLLLAGLRVDHNDAGILISFGGHTAPDVSMEQALQTADYVSRAELAATTQAIFDTTMLRLGEIERRQTGMQTELVRSLYGALSERQDFHYADLKQRISYAALAGPSASSTRGDGGMAPRVWREPTED